MPRPSALVCWRLLVAASAATGVLLAAWQYDVWWTALSQLASVAAAAAYVGLVARATPAAGAVWVRGALGTLMCLVSLAFLAMQHGNVLDPYSVFEHLVTPALVVADVVLVGRRDRRLPRWYPLTWALVPLPYLAWYVAADLRVYAPLDPHRPLAFAAEIALLLVLLLVAGHALARASRGAVTLTLGEPETIPETM